MERKKIIDQFDLIRAISCIGIVLFHFSVEYGRPRFFSDFGSGITYGDIYVTVFFFISGALLFYNYREVTDLRAFYKKRAIAIFPAFYLAWGVLYLKDVIRYKSWFYKGNPFSLILSLVGMDGYLAYKVNDYYILGEWFIGAIILLYVLFPMIVRMDRKCRGATVALIGFMYISSVWINISGMMAFRTLPSCLISFYFGMLFVDYRQMAEKYWLITCMALVVLKIIPYGNVNLKGHLAGICMACVLYGLGTYLMKYRTVKEIMQCIGGLSYYIFLTHHYVICLLIKYIPTGSVVVKEWILLLVVLIVTFISAILLKQICCMLTRYINSIGKFCKLKYLA